MRPNIRHLSPARRIACPAGSVVLAALLVLPASAVAQEFALYVSPPRLEASAKAGEPKRHVIEFHHVGRATGRFRLYTNDWTLKEGGTVDFSNELAPGSCRPWVALERRELTIAPNGRYRFRIEITPPAGTPARECRFAVMIEGLDTTRIAQGPFSFPVAGRIGVIAYVTVGDVAPKLVIGKSSLEKSGAGLVPMIEVSNQGDATGRLDGYVLGKDADGKEFELSPDSAPILPGVTRKIALIVTAEDGKPPPAIRYPLTVKGNLEWGKSREPLDLRFEP